jgi:thiamine biosynthesis lipoprotein
VSDQLPDRDDRVEMDSRRTFLARTAVLGAAAVLTSAAAGQERRAHWGPTPQARGRTPLAAGQPVRMAVGETDVLIVALCDVCDERLESARKACAERQGIEVDVYRDYVDVLNRDDIHGVLIAAPEHWHGQMARDAIRAGKDVYVEKPMTLRLDDALHLRQVVLDHPEAIFQVGTQMMMLPKYQEAMRLVAEGAIGKPTLSQTSYCRNSLNGEWLYYGINPEWEPGVNLDWEAWCGPLGVAPWNPEVYARWRRYRDYSTGIIGDLLVHQMTPLMMALNMGWPTRVVAIAGHYVDKVMENHDQINITVEFEGEHTMVVAGSTCNEVGLETMIRGHQANLYLGGRHVELRPERLFAEDIDPRRVDCPDIGNDQDQLRLNWLECIRTRKPAMSGIDLATRVMVIVDLATRSAWHLGGDDPVLLRAVGEEALAAIEETESRLSRFQAGSLLSRINRLAAERPVRVDPDLMELLADCATVTAGSRGAFDVTVGHLMEAWGFHRAPGVERPPAPLAPRSCGSGLRLDRRRHEVSLLSRDDSIDLGGVGKGHALDAAAAVVRDHRVTCALIHGGTSSVIAIGAPPGTAGWRVALAAVEPRITVMLRDAALSVSAPHGRMIREGDRDLGHVLDPRTGEPAGGAALTAVVGPSARLADAWSTALVVLGRRPATMPESFTTLIVPAGAGDHEMDTRPVIRGATPELFSIEPFLQAATHDRM